MKKSLLVFPLLITFAWAQKPMVDWPIPALSTHKPQTDAEAEMGKTSGRKLPVPELLQPAIDGDLPAYRPMPASLSGNFKAASSDVLPGLVQAWVQAFRKYYPHVTIDLQPPYAGSLGAKELVKGTLDIAFVSRELKPDDITEFKAKFGYDPLSVPISGGAYRHFGFLDAIGFFVNRDNPIDALSFDQLDAMLSATHALGGRAITKWGELGLTGEWADKPIHVYGVRPWNGFEEFIRQRVLSTPAQRGEWRDDINFEKVVFPLSTRVASDRYGIGYAGLAYIDAAVKMIALADRAGGAYYAPTYENIARATYPLTRLIFLNTNKAPNKPLHPALQECLRFVLSSDGQRIVLNQAIYLPLREFQAARARSLFEK